MHCIYTDRCYHKERWYSLELLHIICVLVYHKQIPTFHTQFIPITTYFHIIPI